MSRARRALRDGDDDAARSRAVERLEEQDRQDAGATSASAPAARSDPSRPVARLVGAAAPRAAGAAAHGRGAAGCGSSGVGARPTGAAALGLAAAGSRAAACAGGWLRRRLRRVGLAGSARRLTVRVASAAARFCCSAPLRQPRLTALLALAPALARSRSSSDRRTGRASPRSRRSLRSRRLQVGLEQVRGGERVRGRAGAGPRATRSAIRVVSRSS